MRQPGRMFIRYGYKIKLADPKQPAKQEDDDENITLWVNYYLNS